LEVGDRDRAADWRSDGTSVRTASKSRDWDLTRGAKGGSALLKKERELKEDGRYIIFYTFEDEEEDED
jgi:hypothetical protein